jgi:hypothetical protein
MIQEVEVEFEKGKLERFHIGCVVSKSNEKGGIRTSLMIGFPC